ncbi:MAG: hypothetical protein KDA99_06120, partial [Planctomycetales bacterium]|nr:hypothetical protein [Planctomycetales bacterium]
GLPAEQRAPFLQQLGPLYLSVAEFREALRVFKQAATIDPTDEEARIIWFDLAQQLGDEREMDEVMELIGQNNGKDSAEYKWTQAMRVIWMVQNERTDISQLQKAQALLEDARGRRENWYVISQTEAKIHLLRNQIDRAINSLKETLEKGPPRGVVVRELARLLYGEGRKEEAYTYVKRLDEAEWGSLERRIAFEMQARSGVAPSELPVDESSTDPADHLWAGQVLAEVGKLEEAEKEMRRAAELGPSSPMVWKQLVRLLVVRKKMVDAEMAVRRAQLMLPEYELPMTMGDCYAMLNQAGLAQHHYMMALEQHPNDVNVLKSLAALYMALGNEPAARGMLDRIIGQEKPHAADANPTVTWARRVKAQMLAGTEVYEDFTKALRLIEENSPNRDSMSIADSVLWAKLSLARPEMSSRNEALRLLEATAKRRELTSEENLLLASLYEQVGRWPECQSLMVDILADRPNDTNLLQPWISWLLKHKDFGQAKQWLRNLDGRSTFAIEVSSELDVREKRTSDFLKTMQGLLAKSDDPNFVAQTAYFADLTDRLAKYDPSLKKTAEKLWRAHVQKNPDSRPSLAAFLGTTGDKAKAEEGLKILQSLNKDKIDPRYTAIGLAILRRSNHAIAADSPEFKMVGQWVKNALDNAPNSKSAIMHMAEYQDLSGNFAEVEMLYRKYLNMPDISPQQRAMVSNNLAYAMALEGNSKESLTLIEYAISVLGPRADLLDTRAIIHLVKEDPRAAIEDLEVAIIDSGGSSLELFHLAVAKLMANDEDGSREALQNAQEVGLDVRQLNKLEQSQYQNLVQKLRIKNS